MNLKTIKVKETQKKNRGDKKIRYTKLNKSKNIELAYGGFTLIEIMVVITILGILVAIAVPSFSGLFDYSKKQVCIANSAQLGRMYNVFLVTAGLKHSDILFEQFLTEYDGEICPEGGDIRYFDGKVVCSIHVKVEETSENANEGVPFL